MKHIEKGNTMTTPLPLQTPDSQILPYQTEDGRTRIEFQVKRNIVWLSLNQMAGLFQRHKSVVSKHIRNVFKEDELSPDSTVAKFATVQKEGSREVSREIEFFNIYCNGLKQRLQFVTKIFFVLFAIFLLPSGTLYAQRLEVIWMKYPEIPTKLFKRSQTPVICSQNLIERADSGFIYLQKENSMLIYIDKNGNFEKKISAGPSFAQGMIQRNNCLYLYHAFNLDISMFFKLDEDGVTNGIKPLPIKNVVSVTAMPSGELVFCGGELGALQIAITDTNGVQLSTYRYPLLGPGMCVLATGPQTFVAITDAHQVAEFDLSGTKLKMNSFDGFYKRAVVLENGNIAIATEVAVVVFDPNLNKIYSSSQPFFVSSICSFGKGFACSGFTSRRGAPPNSNIAELFSGSGIKIDSIITSVEWEPPIHSMIQLRDGHFIQSGGEDKLFMIKYGVNMPPFFINTPPPIDTTAIRGKIYSVTLVAKDTFPGDLVSYTLLKHPAGMSIDQNRGLITWATGDLSADTNRVEIIAKDRRNQTDTCAFTIVLKPLSTKAFASSARIQYGMSWNNDRGTLQINLNGDRITSGVVRLVVYNLRGQIVNSVSLQQPSCRQIDLHFDSVTRGILLVRCFHNEKMLFLDRFMK
jgi:hypothetical protein